MYKETITLFCYHDGYYRATKFEKVDLIVDRSVILSRYGENSQDRALLHIRYRKNGDMIYVGSVRYLEPEFYEGAEGTFTLRTGEYFSFFINGEWDGPSLIQDNLYPLGFYNYIVQNKFAQPLYPAGMILPSEQLTPGSNQQTARMHRVYALSNTAQYFEIPHFEVTAR